MKQFLMTSPVLAALIWAAACQPTAWAAPIPDVPFEQEYAERFQVEPEKPRPAESLEQEQEEEALDLVDDEEEKGKPANDVRAIAVTGDNTVVVATRGGVYVRHGRSWLQPDGGPDGPAFCLYRDKSETLWVGAWDGIYQYDGTTLKKEEGLEEVAIATIGTYQSELIALGPDGFFVKKDAGWQPLDIKCAKSVHDTALATDGSLYLATQTGLYMQTPAGPRLCVRGDEIVSTFVNAAETGPDGRVWLGCKGGIEVFEGGVRRAHYGTADGLPNYEVHSLSFDADGRLWAGTSLGVVRFDGKTWSLRHTLRWLPSDMVRGVAFDTEGTAWIATDEGVGAIHKKKMTLSDKAEHYLKILRQRHVRPPGLVEKCILPRADDFTKWRPVDDDNDGSYTAMYMAAECLRYAVTKEPEAKEFADQAWKAVAFLHEVPGDSGFVARTVVPISWKRMHDMNKDFTPQKEADERVENPRFKPVQKRWRESADGKWWWKGDTSSDEIVGHFYAFNVYYHLAADEEQKKEVRALCKRLMDYIISGEYTLIDPETGSHTLWGMWNPERLNNDPDWRTDAPINCTEMLSFLLLTHSLTGEQKYKDEFDRLFTEYKFGERLPQPKSYGTTERTHIDDDLLSMVWPTYVLNETDAATRTLWKQGCAWTYSTIEHDVNPMFNFTYAWAGIEGTHNDESVAFLRDTPLDLRQFSVDSSQREDLRLRRFPILEDLQTDRVLPPSERGTMRWDKNPWAVFSGDFGDPKGHREASGTYWLLPYWLGRYLDIIGPPQR